MTRTPPSPKQRARRGRRGSAMIVALALVPLAGMGALVVDIGAAYIAYAELQAGVDASSLAGAAHLDQSEGSVERARDTAREFARLNTVRGEPIRVDEDAIQIGTLVDEVFFETDEDLLASHIRVTGQVPGGIGTLFASFAFDQDTLHVGVTTQARGPEKVGAGAVDCYLPIAIPDCSLDRDDIELVHLQTSDNNNDNMGWAKVGGGNPSASEVRNQLEGQCDHGESTTQDIVGLNNGEIATVFQEVRRQIDGSDETWEVEKWGLLPEQMDGSTVTHYGNVVQGPIMLFETPDEGECGEQIQFNGDQPITGFGWGVVYDVRDIGSYKNLRLRVDFTNEYEVGTAPGGLMTNITVVTPPTLED